MPRPFIHDQYAPIGHKAELSGVLPPRVASWVPPDSARRLAAYRILAAYRDNCVRQYLPDGTSDDEAAKYREYGHGALLVQQARAAVLGDEQTLDVPDATPPADGADPAPPEAARLWLQEWAKRERLWLRLTEAEGDCQTLGDCVYTLGWDPEKARPRLRTFDPGFYFPVLGEGDDDEFPTKVHLGWEQEREPGKFELHRLTWQLAGLRPAVDEDTGEYLYTEQGRPVPQPGDTLNADSRLVREYPWNTAPVSLTCYFTHAVWQLDKVRGDLYDLDAEAASYRIDSTGQPLRDLDLRVDFLPVVHVPNDAAGKRHFGQSLLLYIAQVLDDLGGTDTDLAAQGSLAGAGALVTKGAQPGPLAAGPGGHLALEADGSAEYLDTSRNLDALLKLDEHLLRTLSVNSRLTQAVLGRVDASDVPSGVALALSFSPTKALVREARQVRDEKLPLLLRMALRFGQAAQQLPAGPTPDARVLLGAFMPTDTAAVVEQVTAALNAGAMSTRTAVLALQEAGLPIDDADAEVARIKAESFKKAADLLEATGVPEDVDRFLGIDRTTEPPSAP